VFSLPVRTPPLLFIPLLPSLGCAASQREWAAHKDPSGFTINVPSGWKVRPDASTGKIEIAGPGGERVVIWPVFIASALDVRGASALLRLMAGMLAPGVSWAMPQAMAATAIRMSGGEPGRSNTAAITWSASPKGCAAFVYLLAAPEAAYRRSEEAFARILTSFSVTGSGSQPRASRMRYVRWSDPRENAFSLEVPEGWTVQGGLFRFASVDIRGAWEVVSPDGEIRISGGDPEVPYFTEPTPMLAMTGFPEGSWYSPGYGVRLLVRRYLPGAVFVREYVQMRARRFCSEPVITANRDLPEAVAAINQVHAQFAGTGVNTRLSAGEAAFSCRNRGRTLRGYYFAGTQYTQVVGMPGGIWNAEYLAGFIAAEDKLELAREVFDRILRSIELNPQWLAMQQNLTAATSRIVSRTHAEISRIIDDSYWRRQATMDEISRRRSNVILGLEDVIDPVTGRELKLESGSNYYWIDHRGTILGTETHVQPGIDFREMIRLP